ncbi:hypothetical protein DH2020_044778 [Rehmannia glutinosa]|uniref:Indole-3-acetic acid-amido synthetase n=1 Tax=Rehmannia glutinosa TaxID=99300 RepID=A0ABR0UG00_REHGL
MARSSTLPSPMACDQEDAKALHSGTSGGEPKLFPSIKEEQQRRMFLCTLVMPVMNLYVKGLAKGKGLYFMFSKSETETPGGLVARSALTSLYKSDHFKNRPYNPYYISTSPNEAIYCTDTLQSIYTQMLCGLYEREQVNRVGMVFASGLLRVIRFLQLNWQQLTHDIRTGSLNPKLTDTSIRQYMTQILAQRDASSECFFGINLNPMCKPSEVSYTIMPNMAYFEFLPHEPNSMRLTHSKLVDLVDVKVGEEYELVITTYTGLYRYQVGDILRVTRFHNSAPQFQFIRRKNMVLGIDTDKTDETELQAAVENASQLLREFNTSVVEYTSYADTTTIPGHYVIYWELLGKNSANSPSDKVLEQCCLTMEESLNSVYRRCRVADKSIGPLEIRIVKNETFEQLMDYAISRGTSMNQYKVPRCVSSKPIVDLLDSRVLSKHFSPSLPHWTSELRL